MMTNIIITTIIVVVLLGGAYLVTRVKPADPNIVSVIKNIEASESLTDNTIKEAHETNTKHAESSTSVDLLRELHQTSTRR